MGKKVSLSQDTKEIYRAVVWYLLDNAGYQQGEIAYICSVSAEIKEISLRRGIRHDERMKALFYASLRYLIDEAGYRQQEIGHIYGYSRSTVNHWYLDGRMPQDDDVIMPVILFAMGIKLSTHIISAASSKLDELSQEYGHTAQGCLDFLKARGESYADIAAGGDTTDTNWPPKVWRWHKGKNKPRQRKGADVFREMLSGHIPPKALNSMVKRMPIKVENEMESQIMARVAEERGLHEKARYALFHISEPLGIFLGRVEEVEAWRDWCVEYEARKARGEV